MKYSYLTTTILFNVLIASGTVYAQSSPADAPCRKNFKSEGSFFAGRQFSTESPLPGVTPDTAYKKAYTAAAKRSWQIVNSDKDARVISITQAVNSLSSGKTIPINIIISANKQEEASLAIKMSLTRGLSTDEKGVMEDFCKLVDEIIN